MKAVQPQKPGSSSTAVPDIPAGFLKTIPWIGGLFLAGLLVFLYSNHVFRDPAALQAMISSSGAWGVLLFLGLQILQVIVPILPGGVSGSLGMLCFGIWKGFWLSYIGVVIGSILLFELVRRYGNPLIEKIANPKLFAKYQQILKKSEHYDWIFALLIFMPIAPDDILVMAAGLTDMPLKKFLWIILLGKPISMFLYSYGLLWIASLF